MKLYDEKGVVVHGWEHGRLDELEWASGGKRTWWFTVGKGSQVWVQVHAVDGAPFSENNKVTENFNVGLGEPDGHCFHSSPVGKLEYAGDSNTRHLHLLNGSEHLTCVIDPCVIDPGDRTQAGGSELHGQREGCRGSMSYVVVPKNEYWVTCAVRW
jgi:hypothetical protein